VPDPAYLIRIATLTVTVWDKKRILFHFQVLLFRNIHTVLFNFQLLFPNIIHIVLIHFHSLRLVQITNKFVKFVLKAVYGIEYKKQKT